MEAILLLGHGCRLTQANNTLKEMAHLVKKIGQIPVVEIAFLQFGKPDFFEAVSTCVAKGAKKIIVHPYFLYKGRHFQEDITEMIQEIQRQHKDIEFILTEPFGTSNEDIANLILERVKKVDIEPVKILTPSEIEEKSLEIIAKEMGETNFNDNERVIVKRVIHTTGDFDFTKNLRFHPNAVASGIKAIKDGKNILVDVKMVEAGINKQMLARWGGKVICRIESDESNLSDQAKNSTRTERGIEIGVHENHNIGIVTIGNAPTALYKIMKLIRNGVCSPDLVIGVPVGFVKAVESKEVLLHMKYPFITSLGRKGGSPVAVAIVNALLKMAEEEK